MLGVTDSRMSTSNAVVCGNAGNTEIIVKVFYIALMFALGWRCEPFCKICFDVCLPFCFLRRLCSVEKVLDLEFRKLTTNGNLKGVINFLFSFSPGNELLACLKNEINFIQISRRDKKMFLFCF